MIHLIKIMKELFKLRSFQDLLMLKADSQINNKKQDLSKD